VVKTQEQGGGDCMVMVDDLTEMAWSLIPASMPCHKILYCLKTFLEHGEVD
jgi:hypothetical protein